MINFAKHLQTILFELYSIFFSIDLWNSGVEKIDGLVIFADLSVPVCTFADEFIDLDAAGLRL
jgi:hypothetical protein